MSITKSDYKELLLEQIKKINTDGLPDEIEIISTSKIIEEQKVYFWIRLYLKEQELNTQIGDDIIIKWEPTGEELVTKFICYGKKGLERDHNEQVINYNPEDDKKVICLMIDTKLVNFNDDIPFIRTLFKTGHHYEYQLVKREELLFINQKNGIILDYYDCDF